MEGRTEPHGLAACTGCAICVLPCPVWRDTHDPWLTPHGRARARQGGADVLEVADSLLACTLCGACLPVCPEKIDVAGEVRRLRVELTARGVNPLAHDPVARVGGAGMVGPAAPRVLMAGPALAADAALLERVVAALEGIEVATDDGRDLAWAAEAGVTPERARMTEWLDGLHHAREVVVVEGMLAVWLAEQRPSLRVRGLGEVLLSDRRRVNALSADDLLVLDARSFHAAYGRMLPIVDRVRRESGCWLNLDLQRVAIPAAETGWTLQGITPDRVIVENPADVASVREQTDLDVVHLVDVADA